LTAENDCNGGDNGGRSNDIDMMAVEDAAIDESVGYV
jgi:hypothetical protein